MSDLRIPEIPLPPNYIRVVAEEKVTKEDVERVRKTLQQRIDSLEGELKLEKDLVRRFGKSGEVLQEILASPSFHGVNLAAKERTGATDAPLSLAQINEPPVEYVEVVEIELSDDVVKAQEESARPNT
ncbi:MAG: hypothetical protein LDLANPLL_00503 [Turneriella sp.]|nr:hypothetical protein [Turneriella sp.]